MVALASVLAAGPAAAERLIASLTNHRVMITSSYSGVELVLFGSVEGALAWTTSSAFTLAKCGNNARS